METWHGPYGSLIQCVYRLKEASEDYEFRKLETKKNMTTEDELILRLIEGIKTHCTHKILKRLQISNLNLEVSLEFLPLELIKEINLLKDYQETYNTTKFVIKANIVEKNMREIWINPQGCEKYEKKSLSVSM